MNLGLIGAGERGRHVMSKFQKTEQVDVTAVCDVYARDDRQGEDDGAERARASATTASCSR